MPMIRSTALNYIENYTPESGDSMMRMMAGVLRGTVLLGNVVPQVVEDGLLQMMETEGHDMSYCIFFNSSLVLMQNRLTLQERIHQRLMDVLVNAYPAEFASVLHQIDYPQDWHVIVQQS